MAREIDVEKIVEKLESLRDYREEEISSNENEKIKEDLVLDVKYLGTIEWEDSEKGYKEVYALLEQIQDKNGDIKKLEKYYTEDMELLGTDVKEDGLELGLNPKYKDKEDLCGKLQKLDKEGKISLKELKEKELEEISNKSGIDKKEIKEIAEIDMSKKELTKISSKQEIDINTKVTDKETIGKVLGVQNKYTKIAIVYSDNLEVNENTTKFTIMGIDKNGNAHEIEGLEQNFGKTPNKRVNEISRDGSEVEEEKLNSIYSIKGKTEEAIGINIGNHGTIEATYIRTPKEANKEAISTPIETKSTYYRTTTEVKEFMNKQKNVHVNDNIKNIEKIKELEGIEETDNMELSQIDDIEGNSIKSIEFDKEYIDRAVNRIMENSDVNDTFTKREIEEKLKRDLENNYEKQDLDEIINNTKNDLERDAEMLPHREH